MAIVTLVLTLQKEALRNATQRSTRRKLLGASGSVGSVQRTSFESAFSLFRITTISYIAQADAQPTTPRCARNTAQAAATLSVFAGWRKACGVARGRAKSPCTSVGHLRTSATAVGPLYLSTLFLNHFYLVNSTFVLQLLEERNHFHHVCPKTRQKAEVGMGP